MGKFGSIYAISTYAISVYAMYKSPIISRKKRNTYIVSFLCISTPITSCCHLAGVHAVYRGHHGGEHQRAAAGGHREQVLEEVCAASDRRPPEARPRGVSVSVGCGGEGLSQSPGVC